MGWFVVLRYSGGIYSMCLVHGNPLNARDKLAILANEPRKFTHVALVGLELFHCRYDICVAAVSDFLQ